MKLSWLHYPVIGLFVAALFVWFGSSLRPVQTSLQYDFDEWLVDQRVVIQDLTRFLVDSAEVEEEGSVGQSSSLGPVGSAEAHSPAVKGPVLQRSVLNGPALDQLPSLKATVRLAGETTATEYLVNSSEGTDRPYQILRLLDLMKEADIFDRSRGPRDAVVGGEAVVSIEVSGASRSFQATLSRRDIEGNLPALLMMRLFEEFSGGGKVAVVLAEGSSVSNIGNEDVGPQAQDHSIPDAGQNVGMAFAAGDTSVQLEKKSENQD